VVTVCLDVATGEMTRGLMRMDNVILSEQLAKTVMSSKNCRGGLTSGDSWCERWNMKVSEVKTQSICFSHRRRPVQAFLTLKGRQVPFVNHVKYAGVIFCKKISWRFHISLHHRVQNGSGAHPTSYPMGIRGSFPGVKRPGREADHSPPSRAKVKNAWSYTSTLPIRLHGMMLS
jgi:hypothetical protein